MNKPQYEANQLDILGALENAAVKSKLIKDSNI